VRAKYQFKSVAAHMRLRGSRKRLPGAKWFMAQSKGRLDEPLAGTGKPHIDDYTKG